MDVGGLLRNLGLGKYEAAFRDNAIDEQVLRHLTPEDLKEIGAVQPVDAVANTVRGKTAEQLLRKVKRGGVFASVTGAPANTKDYPSVSAVSFVSRQDAKTVLIMAQAVRAGRLVIPIERKLPLSAAREGHEIVGRGGAGKVLLLP